MDLFSDLLDPAAYPGAVHRVETIETHISRLYLADERVYKVKKPVRFAFLDFSTPELRRFYCEEEVRLNRRLSPDVYLGVVPIRRGMDGRHSFRDEGGEVVDHAVCMRRLPADRMLDALLERGAIDNALLERLAGTLARFHAAADDASALGTLAAVRTNVRGNVEELAPFVGAALTPRLHAFLLASVDRFLDEHADLLAHRVAAGRIKDGHGDLHAQNVCALENGELAIYDCIEFSAPLRAGDVACDLAFLAMDLDKKGFPGFAGVLARRYAAAARDPELELLLPFYKAYRACVRAKVAMLGAPSASEDARAHAAAVARAADYLHLAAGYALPPPVLLLEGSEAAADSVAAPLARALRARVLDAGSPTLADLPHTLGGVRAAVIALPPRVQGLEPALADAAARLERPLLELDADELAGEGPSALTAGVIERLLPA